MIRSEDLKRMKYCPVGLDKKIVEAYPKLAGISETPIKDSEEKMVKYMILMYSPDSPLRDYYPDVAKRKEFAAHEAGLPEQSDKTKRIIELTDERFVELLNGYLVLLNNLTWSLIVTAETAFYEFQQKVLTPVGSEKDDKEKDKDILGAVNLKTRLMESMDATADRLKKYYRELTSGDDQVVEVIRSRKRITPEAMAGRA